MNNCLGCGVLALLATADSNQGKVRFKVVVLLSQLKSAGASGTLTPFITITVELRDTTHSTVYDYIYVARLFKGRHYTPAPLKLLDAPLLPPLI